MPLTDEQLAEAAQELKRRQKERTDRLAAEYHARQAAAEERFWARMLTKYPALDRDTMYDIWSEIDNWFH